MKSIVCKPKAGTYQLSEYHQPAEFKSEKEDIVHLSESQSKNLQLMINRFVLADAALYHLKNPDHSDPALIP